MMPTMMKTIDSNGDNDYVIDNDNDDDYGGDHNDDNDDDTNDDASDDASDDDSHDSDVDSDDNDDYNDHVTSSAFTCAQTLLPATSSPHQPEATSPKLQNPRPHRHFRPLCSYCFCCPAAQIKFQVVVFWGGWCLDQGV